MPNCLEKHSLCKEANWGLPAQHFQKGLVLGINKKISKKRSQGQTLWYHMKALVTRNTHVQYESPTFSGLKVMAKVKVLSKVGQTSCDLDFVIDGYYMYVVIVAAQQASFDNSH